MGFVAHQPQQEPDLLLADADMAFSMADGTVRQPVAEPAWGGAKDFDMLGEQAGFLAQFAVHGFHRRLIGVHAALRELPAIPVHASRPEHPAVLVHQHDAHVGAKPVRIDHDADSRSYLTFVTARPGRCLKQTGFN